jgi:molecular chaperone DnaJ
MPKDYYATLGLSRGASLEEIKKSYRRLSKELHPDRTKGNKELEARYKDVNEAYEVLSDPEKKKMYDQFGSVPGGGNFQGFSGFDFSDFGGAGIDFGNLGDLFGSFFGGSRAQAARARDTRGEDIEVEMAADLRELIADHDLSVDLRRLVRCALCDGKGTAPGTALRKCDGCQGTGQVVRTRQSFFGTVQQSFVCPDCNGAGEVPERACADCDGEGRREEHTALRVTIPAGIEDGQTLRIAGQGNAGRRGGAAGDLFVHVHVRGDPRFEREGTTIRSGLSISALDAILGTSVPIETIHGPVTLTVPEGTQPGTILRMKGKGMPLLNASRTGDHEVTVHVEIPRKLSRAERKILQDWRKVRG